MTFLPFFDTLGQAGVALFGGILLGFVFGVGAQRSRFCTRSALLDVTAGGDGQSLATWLAGSAVALLGVQILLSLRVLDLGGPALISTAQALSGAVAGGILFGVGMVVARGCVSRLLVLAASGNLRALVSILVAVAAGYAAYAGVLTPLLADPGKMVAMSAIGGGDMRSHLDIGQTVGIALAVAVALSAAATGIRSGTPVWRIAGGATVGLTLIGGWYLLNLLSTPVFEPIGTAGLAFGPDPVTTGSIALAPGPGLRLDQGLLIGGLVGAFLSAVLFREFRISTLAEPGGPTLARYVIGAALMGFGGMLAVGCTVGAGGADSPVLAVSWLAGLASMVVGAVVADRLVDASPAIRDAEGESCTQA